MGAGVRDAFPPPIFLCALGCGVFVSGLKRVMFRLTSACAPNTKIGAFTG